VRALLADMMLRDVLQSHGIQTVSEFARRAELSIQQAWNLWHGYSQVGLRLAKTIAETTEIPLAELVTLAPTPKTPARHPRPKPSAPPKQGRRPRHE
jgi:transcriptional regulator with XRE-family HTH domain